MKTLYLVSAAAAAGALAVPAGAQVPYSYPYAQPTYPQPQPYGGYAQPYAYGQQQQYGTNPVEQIINQLLGNRYNVSDRTAVSRCASAAIVQAQAQYGNRYAQQPYGQPGYGQPYGQPYNPQYGYGNGQAQMRVTAITQVQRRSNRGLQVVGTIDSGMNAAPYGNAYGYQNQRYADPRYAQAGDIAFRCNIDYRGTVSGVRLSHNATAYRR